MSTDVITTTLSGAGSIYPEETVVYRPCTRSDTEALPFNSDGRNPRYVLRDENYEHYLLTQEVGALIFNLMDGTRTPHELREQMREQYHMNIKEDQLMDFLDSCGSNNLLVADSWRISEHTEGTGKRAWRSLGFYRFLISGEGLAKWMVARQKWWLNPITKLLSVVFTLCALSFILFPPAKGGFTSMLNVLTLSEQDLWVLLLPVLILFELALHEFGHALACAFYGVRSRGFGFGLLWGVMPIFFTDTTDAYSLNSKYKRIAISLAGPFMDLMLLGLLAIIVWLTPPDTFLHRFALGYSGLPAAMIFLNLNPFLVRLDGYWVVTDFLELPSLRTGAIRYIVVRVKHLFGRANPDDLRLVNLQIAHNPRLRAIYLTYAFVAIVWTGSYVSVLLYSIIMSVVQLFGW